MIIPIAKNLTFPEHELRNDFEGDNQLVGEALEISGKAAALNDKYSGVHAAYFELNRRAVNSVVLFFAGKSLTFDDASKTTSFILYSSYLGEPGSTHVENLM
jgi:ribosomal protein S17E